MKILIEVDQETARKFDILYCSTRETRPVTIGKVFHNIVDMEFSKYDDEHLKEIIKHRKAILKEKAKERMIEKAVTEYQIKRKREAARRKAEKIEQDENRKRSQELFEARIKPLKDKILASQKLAAEKLEAETK